MPVSSNPSAIAPFWLHCDEDTPLRKRQVLLVKFMSQAQIDQHADLMRQAFESDDNRQCAELLWKAISVGAVGWRNFEDDQGKPLPFNEENFFARYCDQERWDAAWNYPAAVRMTKIDRAPFVSPSPSAGAAGADTPAGNAIPARPTP